MLCAMHLNDNNSLFCVFTNLDDVMCSPNSRFITESMFRSCFSDCTTIWNSHYASFVSCIYLPCVFRIGTCSYLGGMTLNAWSMSLTSTWLSSSLSYALSPITTDNGKISDVFVMSGWKSMVSCLVGARLILIVQIICCTTSATANDSLLYFLLLVSFALSA